MREQDTRKLSKHTASAIKKLSTPNGRGESWTAPAARVRLRCCARSIRQIDRSVLGSPRVVRRSDRYGDISTSGCRSIPRPTAHQQSRVEVWRVQVQRSMRLSLSKSGSWWTSVAQARGNEICQVFWACITGI